MSWLHAVRTRARLLLARRSAESRFDEEITLHTDLETARLIRDEGLEPAEARRRALAAFGGVERHKESLRDGRGLAWLGGMRLDLRLGARMLVKYPGLTVIGGLAMAFGIWFGVLTFEITGLLIRPSLPLPGGDRIVHLWNQDVQANDPDGRALDDFLVWRESLRSVADLGAWRNDMRNLIGSDGNGRPILTAEISASAFRIAPDRPHLGRTLLPSDEEPGAPPVVVLGWDTWRTSFASDPSIVGKTVQLGESYATVVGVMPERFAFPISHDLWTPLRPALLDPQPRQGPAINVFGRLAPGATLESAQGELTLLGERAAAEFPQTHEHLVPRVAPYTTVYFDPTDADANLTGAIPAFAVLLLVIVCGNVGLLLFARAASRESELVVRTALGASRSRIIAQLFAEALVLGGVALVLGLAGAGLVLKMWGRNFLEINIGELPFWMDMTVSPMSVLYAIGLTVLAAAIAGVMPALRITRGLGAQLRQGTSGAGGVRFSGVWTAVIVAQVAVTVVFPVAVYVSQRETARISNFDVGFTAAEYLGVELGMDAPEGGAPDSAAKAALDARFTASLAELRRRLESEPGVTGVTFVDRLPRDYHSERLVEVDGPPAPGTTPRVTVGPNNERRMFETSIARIDPNYFDVLRSPILTGRAFHTGDLARDARVVIVDEAFVDLVLGGGSAIGRQLRFTGTPGGGPYGPDVPAPWYEIVGVVKELGMLHSANGKRQAGLYLPAVPGSAGALNLMVHGRGDPLLLVPRIRTLATSVDPLLGITAVSRMDQVADDIIWVLGMWLRIAVVLSAVAVLLSLAGIYAVLAYSVARRTREIGVRVALGASHRSVIAAIFRRPIIQVAIGVVLGGVLVFIVSSGLGGLTPRQVALLGGHVVFMFGVCLLACIVPTRRALGVEPTVALRVE